MHPARLRFLVVNAVGGCAIFGSYLHGIATHAEPGKTLWGGVPLGLQPLYTVSMLTASLGFVLWFVYFFRLLPDAARLCGSRWSLRTLYLPLLMIHICSTLWMPLTFRYVASPSPLGWALVRIDLLLVGLGALLLIAAAATSTPRGRGFVLALIGACAFSFQTAVLDALVWPSLF